MVELDFTNISLGLLAVGVLGILLDQLFRGRTLKQTGSFRVDNRLRANVYYPIRYLSAPNLRLDDDITVGTLDQYSNRFELIASSVTNPGSNKNWTTIGRPDPEHDHRSIFEKASIPQKIFGVVGFIGSIASILSLFVD